MQRGNPAGEARYTDPGSQHQPYGPVVDHLISMSKGGPHTPENCGTAHWTCNAQKHTSEGFALAKELVAESESVSTGEVASVVQPHGPLCSVRGCLRKRYARGVCNVHRVHVGTLKTGRSRTVALPAFVVDELAATCEGLDRGELIWPSQDGGYLAPPTTKSWMAGALQRCQDADKTFPRVTAHDLRHTAASLAIASGANPKVVQRMLGHASAAMTLDVYADLFDSDFTAVADKLSETVGKMWARGQNDAV